ncbi:MAG TPA: hypothetical protein VN850_03355 [Candidatus Acidoferrales bacterium]|nr:hypothetical protein [Candidatus Acidoferrales bacterium]
MRRIPLAIGGAEISGTATVSCSGAPTGAICSVPGTVAFNSTAPTSFMVSVSTTARSSWLFPRGFKSVPWLWAFTLIAALALLNSRMSRQLCWARLRFVPLAAVLIYGCGGGSTTTQNSNGTQAGTYTVTVTATSGSTSQTQKLTLIVN